MVQNILSTQLCVYTGLQSTHACTLRPTRVRGPGLAGLALTEVFRHVDEFYKFCVHNS